MDKPNHGMSNASEAATRLAAETSSDSWVEPDESLLLSYFLSNDMNNDKNPPAVVNPTQQNVFKSLPHPYGGPEKAGFPNPPNAIQNPVTGERVSYYMNANSQVSSFNTPAKPSAGNQIDFVPGTPSVHFYGKSSTINDKGKQQAQPHFNYVQQNNNSSSSSSSLPSLAPLNWASSSSLSTTSGNFTPHVSGPQPSSSSLQSDDQPQILGVPNDQLLMLPPKPRLPVASSMPSLSGSSIDQNPSTVHHSHLEWLNQMNSLAQKNVQLPLNANSSNMFTKSQNKVEPSFTNTKLKNNTFSQANQSSQIYFSSAMNSKSKSFDASNQMTRTPSFSTLAASIAQQHESQLKLENQRLQQEEQQRQIQHQQQLKHRQIQQQSHQYQQFQQQQIQQQQQQQQQPQHEQHQQKQQQNFMMLQNQHISSNLPPPSLASPYIQQRQQVPIGLSGMTSSAPVPIQTENMGTTNAIKKPSVETNAPPEADISNLPVIPTESIPPAAVAAAAAAAAARFQVPKTAQNLPESAEKRARRLARNRESARLSRRRKKEHLEMLSEKVNQLHNTIENKRREKVNKMESELGERRHKQLSDLMSRVESESGDNPKNDAVNYVKDANLLGKLSDITKTMGPFCGIRRAIISFQYHSLRQLMLPYQHQFMLWLTLQPENFFTAAKNQRPKAPGRVSSKQIGEEIATLHNQNKQGKSMLTCNASDPSLSWPLFSYEMMLSVEQEEKFLQTYKRLREEKINPFPQSKKQRSNVMSAVTIFSNLKKNMEYRSCIVATRSDDILLNILRPEQTISFLTWLRDKNTGKSILARKVLERSRVHDMGGKRSVAEGDLSLQSPITSRKVGYTTKIIPDAALSGNDTIITKDNGNGDDLNQLCRTLNDNLKVEF